MVQRSYHLLPPRGFVRYHLPRQFIPHLTSCLFWPLPAHREVEPSRAGVCARASWRTHAHFSISWHCSPFAATSAWHCAAHFRTTRRGCAHPHVAFTRRTRTQIPGTPTGRRAHAVRGVRRLRSNTRTRAGAPPYLHVVPLLRPTSHLRSPLYTAPCTTHLRDGGTRHARTGYKLFTFRPGIAPRRSAGSIAFTPRINTTTHDLS